MENVNNPELDTFKEALASVLAGSRSEVQDAIAKAKAEPFSPQTRYTYVPAKDRV